MKTSLTIALVTAALLSYSTPSYSYEDSMSLRICEYVSINDKKRLRKYLKSSKLKIRSIFDSVQCNGKNLLVFSAVSKALDVGEYIIGKLPVKVVKENLPAISENSAHLTKVANKRIK